MLSQQFVATSFSYKSVIISSEVEGHKQLEIMARRTLVDAYAYAMVILATLLGTEPDIVHMTQR